MPEFFDRLIRYFHYYVGMIERRLARHPREIFGTPTKQAEFMFRYNDALEISKAFTDKGTALLLPLLETEKDEELPLDWRLQRVARVYFQLGLNTRDLVLRERYMEQCLERMPNHYRAREILVELQRSRGL